MARRRVFISKDTKAAVWAKTGGYCWYCGGEMVFGNTSMRSGSHIDHVHPWADNGHNDLANLVYACSRCNQQKTDDSVEVFRQRLRDELVESSNWPLGKVESLAGVLNTECGEEVWAKLRWIKEYFATCPLPFYGELLSMEWDHYVI
jgi:hypothetical protein